MLEFFFCLIAQEKFSIFVTSRQYSRHSWLFRKV